MKPKSRGRLEKAEGGNSYTDNKQKEPTDRKTGIPQTQSETCQTQYHQ